MNIARLLSHAVAALFALLSAAMIGLAAGAIWMLLEAATHRQMMWLAVPMGVLIGLSSRAGVSHSRWAAPLLAALAAGLALFYLQVLGSAMDLAGMFGLSFARALQQAGPDMLVQLACLRLHGALLAWMLAGMAVAAASAMSLIRRRPAERRDPA